MIDTSLREGRLPSSQKHAVVTPLLAEKARTGCRRTEKLPVSLQSDIRLKAGGESSFVMARQLPYHTRSDATATVRISTSSQH